MCPGGGVSNFYAYLLGGDVDLSITMTLISTVAALGTFSFFLLFHFVSFFLFSVTGRFVPGHFVIFFLFNFLLFPSFSVFLSYRLERNYRYLKTICIVNGFIGFSMVKQNNFVFLTANTLIKH